MGDPISEYLAKLFGGAGVGPTITNQPKPPSIDLGNGLVKDPRLDKKQQDEGMLDQIMGVSGAGGRINAWHGSPVKGIKQFLSEFIGTGEGNAAYGEGLYSAQNNKIAEWYRDSVSRMLGITGGFSKDGKQLSLDEQLAEYFKPGRVVRGYGGWDKVLDFQPSTKDQSWAVKVISAMNKEGDVLGGIRPRIHYTWPDKAKLAEVAKELGWQAEKPGALYQLELPGSMSDYLDWQQPINTQSKSVQDAISSIFRDTNPTKLGQQPGFIPYTKLAKEVGDNQSDASRYLYNKGIPGIKYLDASSRGRSGAVETTNNFVSFKPEDVKILDMLGMAGGVGLADMFGSPKKKEKKKK